MIGPEKFDECLLNPVTSSDAEIEQELRAGKLSNVFDQEILDMDRHIMLIRYIICIYDGKTPLRSTYPDLNERKQAAADIVGYQPEDEFLEELFNLSNPIVSKAVYCLAKERSSKTLLLLVTNEELFYSINKNVLNDVTEYKSSKEIEEAMAKKIVNLEKAEKILANIDKLETKLFNSEKEAEKVKQHFSNRSVESRVLR